MIEVVIRAGMLGENLERFQIDPRAGVSPRAIALELERHLPKGVPIHVGVDGEQLPDERLDDALQDGQTLILAPATTAGIDLLALLIYAVVSAVVSFAVNYIVSLLIPRPKPPGQPQERGEANSPTYTWDGIRTSYGPGLPIPWVYGRHGLGGQSISLSVTTQQLHVLLALGEGPFHSVAGMPFGSYDNLNSAFVSPLPTGVFVNGVRLPFAGPFNDSTRAYIRPGTLDQQELPAPFVGASITAAPNDQLTVQGDTSVTTFGTTEGIAQVQVTLSWPGGLYMLDPTGNLQQTTVAFDISWRPSSVAGQAWSSLGTFTQNGATQLPVGVTQSYALPAGTSGPIDVRVVRNTFVASVGTVDTTVVHSIVVQGRHQFAYSGLALFGLSLEATSIASGGFPNIVVVCKGSRVRVWDATHGFSEPCWDVPAAPFDFMQHPPGRNPAWCLADFLTQRWGLGSFITDERIDWPAFRRWAAFCDSDPNPADPWGEPSFCVDLVGDVAKPAWEWVLAICAAGRATPIWRNGKLSVAYQYRDAHGDAGITVPAKAVSQLFTSANVEDVQVNWLPKHARATVFHFQFLNEDRDYANDVLPVEDDESTLNNPATLHKDAWIVDAIQAFGVTRPAQLWREGKFRHRVQSKIRREIAFTTGPWALAAEVGDVFAFQHDLLRPFADDVPMAGVMLLDSEATNVVAIDHALAGTGLQIVFRLPDGEPMTRGVASFLNVEVGGRPGCLVTVDGDPVDLVAGTECVVGLVDKLTEHYQIVSLTLQRDMRRQVRAVQWVPEVHDVLTQSEWEGLQSTPAVALRSLIPDPVRNVKTISGPAGTTTIGWESPDSSIATQPVRVYARSDAGEFELLGQTDDTRIDTDAVRPGRPYEVAIVQRGIDGQWGAVSDGTAATIFAEEFSRIALPEVTGARAVNLGGDLLIAWDDIEQRDLEYYELRAGSHWPAARTLYRGRAPRVRLTAPPDLPLQVAPRSRSGLYGPRVTLPAPAWSPPGTIEVESHDDTATTPSGTHDGTEWNAGEGVLELEADEVAGTYTAEALDLGYQAPAFWRVVCDALEADALTVDEAVFEVGSGEATWRTVDTRPASPYAPGHDWQLLVDEAIWTVEDSPATLLVGGHIGEPGTHTRALVESRFEVDSVWSDWKPHEDRVVVAQKMQARVTLNREAVSWGVQVSELRYSAHL
jgi:hypothetical protein